MAYENLKLMVAGLSNEIYLGTMMKNQKYPVMNSKRKVFTDEVIKATAQHMMGMEDGECYEFPGLGKLIWQRENSKDTKTNKG